MENREQISLRVAEQLLPHLKNVAAATSKIGNRKFIDEGIAPDSSTTQFLEDVFTYFPFKGSLHQVNYVLHDCSEFFEVSSEYKDALMKHHILPLSRDLKHNYLSFNKGKNREALVISTLLDGNNRIIKNANTIMGPATTDIYLATVINKNEVDFETFNKHINEDEDTRRVFMKMKRVVEEYGLVDRERERKIPYEYPEAERLVKYLSLISKYVVAEALKNTGRNFICKKEGEDGLPRFYVAANDGNVSFFKPHRDIVSAVNNRLIADFARRREPTFSKEELEEFVSGLNTKIGLLQGDKDLCKNLISGYGTERSRVYANFYDRGLEGLLENSKIKQAVDAGVTDPKSAANSLMYKVTRKDIYPILFIRRSSDDFKKMREITKQILTKNNGLALDIIENVPYELPKCVQKVVKVTRFKPALEGDYERHFNCSMIDRRSTRAANYEDSFDKNYSAQTLLLGILYGKAEYTKKERGVSTGKIREEPKLGNGSSSKNHISDRFAYKAKEIKEYMDTNKLDERKDPIKYTEELVKHFKWMLTETITRSGTELGDSAFKIKVNISARSIFPSGISIFFHGDKGQLTSIAATKEKCYKELVKELYRVVSSYVSEGQQRDR